MNIELNQTQSRSQSLLQSIYRYPKNKKKEDYQESNNRPNPVLISLHVYLYIQLMNGPDMTETLISIVRKHFRREFAIRKLDTNATLTF